MSLTSVVRSEKEQNGSLLSVYCAFNWNVSTG